MTWLQQNIGNIIVVLILMVILIGIVRKMRANKAQGKRSCGCDCGCCTVSNSCHQDSAKAKEK